MDTSANIEVQQQPNKKKRKASKWKDIKASIRNELLESNNKEIEAECDRFYLAEIQKTSEKFKEIAYLTNIATDVVDVENGATKLDAAVEDIFEAAPSTSGRSAQTARSEEEVECEIERKRSKKSKKTVETWLMQEKLIDIDEIEPSEKAEQEQEAVCLSEQREEENGVVVDDIRTIRVNFNTQTFRFRIGLNEPMTVIFAQLAEQLKVSQTKISIVRQSNFIRPDQTPKSLQLGYAEIFDASVDDSPVEAEEISANAINLKFQSQDLRSSICLAVNRDQPFGEIKAKYADAKGLDTSTKIAFTFDGELVDDGSTPTDLDMEDDDCVDVRVGS